MKTVVKEKALMILHMPPPVHGAGMVGKYISESRLFKEHFDADFINLSTSTQMNEIGKAGWKKISRFFRLHKQVAAALMRSRYDVCYFTLCPAGPGFYKDLTVITLLKLFRARMVYHIHDKGVKNNSMGWFKSLLYKFAFHNTKSILLAPSLYEDVHRFVPSRDALYLANGIPFADEHSGRVFAESEKPRLLYLSNMVVHKGVFVLLEACRILKERGYTFQCDFVGAWWDITDTEFQSRVADLGLEDCVMAHGPVYGDSKNAFLREADIFVLPTYKECFPLVLLEAMSYGLPVVATEEGGIPDIVDQQRTGMLVQPKNAEALAASLAALLENPSLRKQLGREGKEKFLKYFTLEKFEHNFVEVLKLSMSNN